MTMKMKMKLSRVSEKLGVFGGNRRDQTENVLEESVRHARCVRKREGEERERDVA